MQEASTSTVIDLLVRILDESFDTKAWQGTTLRGAIRGITARQAAWRPRKDRHSIWDLTLHTAYWKYTVRRRLLGEKRGSFPRKGSNFFELLPGAGEVEWKTDVALLVEQHSALRAAVLTIDPDRLGDIVPGAKWRTEQLIYGAAAHDAYHTGQIQVLKRLQGI